MGKYNSSQYRVVPLVESIKENQENFNAFLSMVHCKKGIPVLACPIGESFYYYGKNEKQLKPTKKHLIALVQYIAKRRGYKSGTYAGRRADLLGENGEERQEDAQTEAIRLINENYDASVLPKEWYIFEGNTNPDIYIEGENYIIVCEGKWTEPHITTKTTHLNAEDEYRNQMVRHIQATLNSTDKKVYAFYIVDASCGYLEDLTEDAFIEQLDCETIKLSSIEKGEIASAFYGYTTWQEVERALQGLKFLTKKEIDLLGQ